MAKSMDHVFDAHMSEEMRQKSDLRARELIEEYHTLQDLRKARELTQVRMAELMGKSQDNISRIEQRSDVLLSTLRSYVEAMGGKLDLRVQFPDRAPVILEGFTAGDDDAKP